MNIQPWDKLSREKQDLYLTLLWQDGYSERAIAEFLQTTKGRIVRRRQTGLKLATLGRPKSKPIVDSARFADLLDLKDMEELEEQGVASISPPAPHAEPPPPMQEPQPKEEPMPEPPPKPEPESEPAKPEEPTTCKWPLTTSDKQKLTLCGKPVVPGHTVCEEHLDEIRRFL